MRRARRDGGRGEPWQPPLEQCEPAEFQHWVLERARAEREREGGAGLHQLLARQSQRAPTQLVVVEPKLASPLRLQDLDEIVLGRAAARERRGNHDIEEAEHGRRRRAGIIRQWIAASPGMVQAGGGLEPSVMLRTANEEAGDVPRRGKRLRRYTTRSNLRAGVCTSDGGHEQSQLVIDR